MLYKRVYLAAHFSDCAPPLPPLHLLDLNLRAKQHVPPSKCAHRALLIIHDEQFLFFIIAQKLGRRNALVYIFTTAGQPEAKGDRALSIGQPGIRRTLAGLLRHLALVGLYYGLLFQVFSGHRERRKTGPEVAP